MTPEAFITAYLDPAKGAEAVTGIPHVFALAQSALESGWGAKAPGNNLFGIRADRGWKGDVVHIATHEVVDGVRVQQEGQAFRAYTTPQASFVDWGLFLQQNARYHAALVLKGDLPAFARAIQAAGYSTSPDYADELIDMMASVSKRLPKDSA